MRKKALWFFIGSFFGLTFILSELSAETFPSSPLFVSGSISEKVLKKTIFFAQNEINNPVQRRKQKRLRETEETSQPEKHWPHYDSCQDMPEQPFFLKEDTGPLTEKTEGSFCTFCDLEKTLWKNSSLRQLWSAVEETKPTLEQAAFKEKLQARVIGQTESKLFQIRVSKSCAFPEENKAWLTKIYKDTSWPEIKRSCEKTIRELKSQIKESWLEMRIHLALTSSALKEDRILPDRATWMDTTPDHLIPMFTDLPKLTKKEKAAAGRLYTEALAEAPLDLLDSSEFKQRLEGNGYLYPPLSGDKYLTQADQFRLKKAAQDLRTQSRDRYFEMIGQNFLLGYLESGTPSNKQLVQAYSKMEQNLTNFLEEEVKASKGNMGLLLSYESLVEELLEEDKGEGISSQYCLAAEKARLKTEKEVEMKEDIKTKLGYASMAPCFFSGGTAFTFCVASASLLSALDVKDAHAAARHSLNRALTGRQFEKISKLKAAQKELWLAKMFLPITVLESAGVAKTIKAVKKISSRNKKGTEGTEPPKEKE